MKNKNIVILLISIILLLLGGLYYTFYYLSDSSFSNQQVKIKNINNSSGGIVKDSTLNAEDLGLEKENIVKYSKKEQCNLVIAGESDKITDFEKNYFNNIYNSASIFIEEKENDLKNITKKYKNGKYGILDMKKKLLKIDKNSMGYSSISDFLNDTNMCGSSIDISKCVEQTIYLKYLFNNVNVSLNELTIDKYKIVYLYAINNGIDAKKIYNNVFASYCKTLTN